MHKVLQFGARRPWMMILLLVLPGLIWVVLDQGMRTGDDVFYQNLAVLIHDHVVCGPRSGEWLLTIMPAKAPWLWYVGALFVGVGRMIGSVRTGLLLYPVLMQVATAALFARVLFVRFRSGNAVRLGVLVLLAAPLYLVMSTQFWTEVNRIFVVVVFLLLLVDHARFGLVEYSLWILVACGLAVLDKTTALAYVLVPAAGIAVCWVRKWTTETRPWTRWVVPGALATGLLTLSAFFYAQNLPAILDWMHHAMSSDHYVIDTTWSYGLRLIYWMSMMGIHLLTPWTVVILLVVVARLLWTGSWSRPWGVAVLQICLTLLLFARTGNPEIRFMLPLLPYLAIATVDVTRVLRGRLRHIVIGAFVLQFVIYQCTAFGALPFQWPFYIYRPVQIEAPAQTGLVDAVAHHADPFRDAILFNTMGGAHPFNSELFLRAIADRSVECRSWDHLHVEDVEIMVDMASMPGSQTAGVDSVLQWVAVHRPVIYVHVDRPAFTGHDGWDEIIEDAEAFHTRLLQTNAYIEKASIEPGPWTIYERQDDTISRGCPASEESLHGSVGQFPARCERGVQTVLHLQAAAP